MNTQLIHWQQYNRPVVTARRRPSLDLFHFMDRALSYLASALTIFTVVIGVAWLIRDPAIIPYVQAAVGTSGLLFLGLAIEAEKTATAWFFLATGITLPILAFMSDQLAPELLVVAGFLIAAWLGVAVSQLSRTARR